MRRSLSFFGPAAIVLGSVLAGAPAWAGDTATAETLFTDGLNAMKKEDYKAACDAFAGSDQADPSPGTEINLALCNEKQGKLATAWGWYRTAAGLADQRGQKDRADAARTEAGKLEPRLFKFIINVKEPLPEGLTVMRDTVAVPAASVGKELPVDPGDHTIEVSAKGKKPYKTTIKVPAGPGVLPIQVPALEDAPVEKTPAGAAGPVDDGGGTQRMWGFIAGGVGIASILTAGAFQGVALIADGRSNDDARSLQSKGCVQGSTDQDCVNTSAQQVSHKDAAKADQNFAIAFGVTGVVLLGVGITLLVTAGSSNKAATTHVLPLIDKNTAGLGLGGSF